MVRDTLADLNTSPHCYNRSYRSGISHHVWNMFRKHNILPWYCMIYEASTGNKAEPERPENSGW